MQLLQDVLQMTLFSQHAQLLTTVIQKLRLINIVKDIVRSYLLDTDRKQSGC